MYVNNNNNIIIIVCKTRRKISSRVLHFSAFHFSMEQIKISAQGVVYSCTKILTYTAKMEGLFLLLCGCISFICGILVVPA